MSSATSHNSSSPMNENRASPQSRRASRVSSPWTQIVRGESEQPIAAVAAAVTTVAAPAPSSPQPAPIEPSVTPSPVSVSVSVAPSPPPSASVLTVETEERSEESGRRPVWRRPSNGSSSEAGGPVMGASSWPALSETTRAPSNRSSSDSLISLGDVASSSSSSPVPVSQGVTNASVPAPSRQVGRGNPNPTPNATRQRSFNNRRNGGSGSNGTVSQPSAQGSFAEMPSHNPSPRGQNQRNGFASQNHGGGDNLSLRDSPRNQNGNHHQNHGGRRNHEQGNQNWNFNRSFNGREGNAQSQRGTPAFVRHAPPPVQPIPPQFMAAQPIPPFGSPVPFPPELAAPYYPRMPFITPLAPAPVFYQFQDAPLNVKLQKQIHYYFSEENLIRDTYLRGHMDDQGFLPMRVIAGFKKVAELTDSIPQIVEALQGSPFVEVQGDRIRKRANWQHWLLPRGANPAVPNPAVSSPAAMNPQSVEAVLDRVENWSLGQSSAEPMGGSSSQLQPAEPVNQGAVYDVQQQQPPTGVVEPVNNHSD